MDLHPDYNVSSAFLKLATAFPLNKEDFFLSKGGSFREFLASAVHDFFQRWKMDRLR